MPVMMTIKNFLTPSRFLIFISTFYLLFSIAYINRPGLQYDEMLFTNASFGNVDNSFIESQWQFGPVKIPLMLMTYIGAVKAYLYAPLFKLFSPSALIVRLPAILLGLVALIFTYKLVFRLFGDKTAALTALLLATDPSYIFSTRMDWGPVALMMFFKMGSLYLFYEYSRTSRKTLLALGALFLGLGLYDKTNFIWYCLALPAALVPVWQNKWNRLLTSRAIYIFLFFFLLGCWPLLLYNFIARGQTFSGQMQPFGNILQSIQFKLQVLAGTLSSTNPYSFFNAGDPIGSVFAGNSTGWLADRMPHLLISLIDFRATLLPEVFAAALLVICMLLFKRGLPKMRAAVFFCLIFVFILGLIFISYRATGPHHVIMLYPFPHIIIAYAVISLFETNSKPGVGKYAAACISVLLIISQVVVSAKYMQSFIRDGGKGWWSDAIYDLADYTQENNGSKYMLMDWGFNSQLLLFSHGKINKEESVWLMLEEDKEIQAVEDLHQKILSGNDLIFVFHTPQYTMFNQPRHVFDLMLEKYQLEAQTVSVFYQRDGTPVYLLKRVLLPSSP